MVAKLNDVAKLANVSPTTVSRVINKRGPLSQKTIDKVKAAMKKLNYQPNTIARSLQGKATKIVGLIFPSLNNPFYAELTDLLERELFKNGYKTIICNSERNSQKELYYLDMLMANQVEGIIAGSHNLNHKDYTNVSAPIVSFDRYLAPGIPTVSSDNYLGGATAAKALVGHKISKIIMLTGSDDTESPTHLRIKGFKEELEKHSLHFLKFPLGNDYTVLRKSVKINKILRDTKPEGIFCSDDLTALLVLNEAKKLGLSSPKDFYLIGYDGVSLIENYFPYLTTIKQPLGDLVKLCVDLLIKQIQNPHINLDEKYELPIRMLAGQTC